MRFQALLVAVILMCSLSLVGYMHSKRKEELKLAKHASFQNVKNRVTRDVLKEYQAHVVESTSLLDKTNRQIDDLKAEVAGAQEAADMKRVEVEGCNSELKLLNDEVASKGSAKSNSDGEFKKKKASLQQQIANLKKEAEQDSKLCVYINKTSEEARKLCNLGPLPETKPEEQKAAEPK